MTQVAFYLFSSILLFSGTMVIFARNPVHSVFYLILAFFNAAGLFILLGAEFLAMLLVIVYVGAVAVLFLFVVMMLDIVPPRKRPISPGRQMQRLAFSFLHLTGILLGFLLCTEAIVWLIELGVQIYGIPLVKPEMKAGLYLIAAIIAYPVVRYISQRSLFKLCKDFMRNLPGTWVLGFIILAELSYVIAQWKLLGSQETIILAPRPSLQHVTNTQALGRIIYTDYAFLLEIAGFILLTAMIGAIVLTHRKREGIKHQNVRDQMARDKKDTLKLHDMPIGEGV